MHDQDPRPGGRRRGPLGWVRDRVSAVPAPLRALLFVVLVCSTTWSVFNPAWQAPDEPQHFGYAETLAEQGAKPTHGAAEVPPLRQRGLAKAAGSGIGKKTQAGYGEVSDPSKHFMEDSNAYPVALDLYAKPPWSELEEKRYDATAREGSRKDGGRATGATAYPPLYYALETIPYHAASSGTAMDRFFLMRWFSGLWALVTTIGGWLLAGELFRRRRLPQLATAASLGMWPMISYLSGAVNPDGMLTALSALVLWLAVRVVKRGTTWRSSAALIALVAAATATKVSGAALAPAALFALVLGLPRVRGLVGDRIPRMIGLTAVLVAVPLLLILLGARLNVLPGQLREVADTRPNLRYFASYLWQFYLPRLPSMDVQNYQFSVISSLPVYNLWFGSSWGAFSWADVWFPRWVYKIFLGVAIVVAAGAGRSLVRAWRGREHRPNARLAGTALVLAIATVGVLGGVHLQDFINGTTGRLPFAQGRYLFPVASVAALAVGAAVLAVPRRLQPAATAAWIGFLVIFQVAALALNAVRFYA